MVTDSDSKPLPPCMQHAITHGSKYMGPVALPFAGRVTDTMPPTVEHTRGCDRLSPNMSVTVQQSFAAAGATENVIVVVTYLYSTGVPAFPPVARSTFAPPSSHHLHAFTTSGLQRTPVAQAQLDSTVMYSVLVPVLQL